MASRVVASQAVCIATTTKGLSARLTLVSDHCVATTLRWLEVNSSEGELDRPSCARVAAHILSRMSLPYTRQRGGE